MSNKQKYLSWFLQLVVICILAPAAWGKFVGTAGNVQIFREIGMGDNGRILIGLIEAFACLLMISPMPQIGALLAFGTMIGAFIAHATVLGFIVRNDMGLHMIMLTGVVLASSGIMYIRRKRLPLIGNTCD